ncbi:hypothetical protein EUTSA_v10019203mg [Eutrema salsugineum]|uniref:Uncharacterized protein n=1 Tax=Eutrema salsugineum TaxID=72664 RepID=V4K9R1_EUTSA|nr:hypothetical protein EUTSA_v10019203mg [Eutrema salsugineum]
MGGILLYALLSRCGLQGMDSGLASFTTIASTLDYSSSGTLLKYLLPVKEPAQAINLPALPIDTILAMAHPLICRPAYALSCLCTVPAKLLFQLATAVDQGGLRDRTGNFYYKDHISKTSVPILALAVYDTVKLIPEHLATFKVLGSPGGPHYGHQDMISGRTARSEIYPLIIQYLQRHDER